jgi:rhodanese-related sulfurtransferase
LIEKHKADTNFVIIDFRPKEKFDKAHIENAVFFDVFEDEVDGWLNGLDKNKSYLIYCTMGYRSGKGLDKMKLMAFKNVFHMYQGIKQWQEEGYKTLAAPVDDQK